MKSNTKWEVGRRGRDNRRKKEGKKQERRERGLWVLNVMILMKRVVGFSDIQ